MAPSPGGPRGSQRGASGGPGGGPPSGSAALAVRPSPWLAFLGVQPSTFPVCRCFPSDAFRRRHWLLAQDALAASDQADSGAAPRQPNSARSTMCGGG
eukprot:5319365-Pyramimonas_sp.AAC.1